MKRLIFLSVLLILVALGNAQTKENFEHINKTWAKFYKAFETLDYRLMAQIHSKDLVRISGGKRILDYQTYIDNYKIGFKNKKENNQTNTISLRFLERINNDTTASERGIYRLKIIDDSKNERDYYGKFHVIFKKIDNQWIITMDYDSTESNTIGIKDFENAYAIDNFERFLD